MQERFDETKDEFHSKRLSTSHEACFNGNDESPKIVEIDTYRTRPRARRITTTLSEYGEEVPYQTMSSPLPCPVPGRISLPDRRKLKDFDCYFNDDECKFSTAQNTPRFANHVKSNAAPPTPAKSVCGNAYVRAYSNFPNYMANTQSFNAKSRSHSAPKQRPETKKRLSLDEIMAARNSLSSVRMQRSSYSENQESWNF